MQMKKRMIGLTILTTLLVFACMGCAGDPSAGGQSETKTGENSGVSSAASDASHTDSSGSKESGGRAEKMDMTITIDGEDYGFPMPFEEFAARGWALYDPELPPMEDWNDGLDSNYHGANIFFSKGDIKALEVIFYNPADSFQGYADCEVAGIRVDYDQWIDGEEAELVMNIPAGSIQVNGQGIGEASRDDIVAALGKDWNLERDPDADPNNFDIFLYWLNNSDANDDAMTISFDENGIFTGMTFLKTK